MGGHRNRAGTGLLLAALLFVVSGCGLLEGSSNNDGGSGNGLEKATIRVGVTPVVDVGSFYLAQDRHYFSAEGLTVEVVPMQSPNASMEAVVGGSVDLAFSTYPAIYSVQGKQVGDLKIVADAYEAVPGHLVAIGGPHSSFRTPQDAPGKRIAVSARNQMPDLATMAVLKAQGVDYTKITWVTMALPDVPAALQRGDVDGAVVPEPWVTRSKKVGAVTVFDGVTESAGNNAMSGWVGNGKFVAGNPKTVAAFQRGLGKGVVDAAQRGTVEAALVNDIKIDPATAAAMTISRYPDKPDVPKLQRIADLMLEFGMLTRHLDVAPMIVPAPGGSGK